MKKEYSQEEINEILLSKSLDEFYMAIVQKKIIHPMKHILFIRHLYLMRNQKK